MSVAARPGLHLEHTFAERLPSLAVAWKAQQRSAPRLLVLNEPLALELGIDPEWLRSPAGVAAMMGDVEGTVAQAYGGHQFGGWSGRLGDGRALLLGEVVDVHGRRRDLHLKGSGRTPFARGGDGNAAIGPMLREHVISEAMHALGIPTTRALAVVATGDDVLREAGPLPGAVLVRVAASHLRVGSFEYAAWSGDTELLQALATYAIERHHPEAEGALELLEAVVARQADLVARWMHVGFVHGVMNTDNMTISGETIDYGPCAFLDAFDPSAVFSSIDHGGRYAFGNQPPVAQWNLERFADALARLDEVDAAAATSAARSFLPQWHKTWSAGVIAKFGLEGVPDAGRLVDDGLALASAQKVDHTELFRALAAGTARDLFVDRDAFDAWHERWAATGPDREAMDALNPVYIPRNHLVEEALAAATAGDLAPYEQLVDVVTRPFDERPGLERYAQPAPGDFGRYVTYCGT
jgi:uncharacterized protein YdiU (UPF0061 family)